MTAPRPLSKRDIVALLAEVDAELAAAGEPPWIMYVLYIVGGAAICARLELHTTVDIDIITDEIPTPVVSAANRVAERHGLAASWLNNQVADFVDLELSHSAFGDLYRGQRLAARVAEPPVLLAMKLMSGRGKDVSDIVALADLCQVKSAEEMTQTWERVFGGSVGAGMEREWVERTVAEVWPLVAARRRGMDTAADELSLARRFDGEDPSSDS